ncbi:A24 family peptidase [Pseudomonas sp. UMAB-40]|uniref:prepilin peptidase n=1 Tax=Pseudomonas sp. UMAB-40 TaxID=1365407 RepID=UPI001C57FCF7|nr:A24 family peptidase [Pseudomonas sp. UMAB-40]
MEFALLVAILGSLCGAIAGWIISSFTMQLPLRWEHFLTREAQEHLGMLSDDQSPPSVLLPPQVDRRFVVVVILCIAISILIFSAVGFTPSAPALMVFAYSMIAAAIIDQEHMVLPDVIVQPLLWVGLINVALVDPSTLRMHVLGAAVGYCLFRWLPKVGEGDAKLCAAVGAWLGLSALPMFVLVAGALGSVVGLIYYARRGRTAQCPFGPSLAVAALALMACKVAGISVPL